MSTSKLFRTGLSLTLIFQVLLSAVVPGGMAAAASELNPTVSDRPVAPINLTPFDPELQLDHFPANSDAESIVAATLDTTLEVSILSSPWATVDSNPSGIDEPQVFVVQAAVTNSGPETAMDVSLTLDYQDDPVNHWTLLPGESAVRTIEQLEVDETYYGYWMASYPNLSDRSHQYTITADAENAGEVSTSENFYMPDPGKTVTTRSTISTGSSGIMQVNAETVVGVLFEIVVEYDLGSNAQEAVFSPVGNPDFDPSSYRLMSTQVRFYNDAETWQDIIYDQLYFGTLDSRSENAEVTYTFLPQKPTPTRLCSYAAVSYNSNVKYDQFYCNEKEEGSIVPITGTLSIAMEKQASAIEIQQGEVVTYSIDYTNTGDLPLTYAWIWDEVDPAMASILLDSISPTPTISNSNLVGWYLGDIPILDFPGSTGTLTFSVEVDGNGQPLADNTLLVNNAFYGVNPGDLPTERALTSTVTTTVQAPAITISKSDGLDSAEPGDLITYTLNITNTGSIAATGLVITDVLPAEVSYLGNGTGQTLVWDNLAPLAPAGGTASITVPVVLDEQIENGSVLTNTMLAQYYNTAGYLYQTDPTFDTTLVNAPVLSISKRDYPDPVLTGRLITYTLSYANQGPGLATNVVITDTLPDSTTFDSCTGCDTDNSLISWDIGELPAYTSGDVTFTVRVDDYLDTGTIISNQDYGITSDQTGTISGPLVTTTVNRDAAIFEGYTFEDVNGNGLYDLGDAAIPGVALTMTNATVPHTTSGGDGYYSFRVETQGNGLISSELPPGMFRTTPGSVYIDATLGITRTVNFGYASNTSSFGVVYGTVFQDDNHDGNQDLGEDGMTGVVMGSAQAVTQSVTSNDLGQYTLRFNSPATATITETNPANYVSTTPDAVQVEVITSSSNSSPVDFGDFLGIKVVGQVFEDLNVNGVKDVGEGGLPDATLNSDTDSFTTGANGEYTLYERLSGTDSVSITETDPAGYVSTNAIPGAGMSRVDANTLQIESPISGNVYTGADYGDVAASSVITIRGTVWNDNGAGGGSLANGLRESGEPGLVGAVISLSSGLTQTTGLNGEFLLYALPDQVITVTESNPSGFVSTNAIPGNDASKLDHDTLRVGPLGGGAISEGNLFGDVISSSVATISGTVFNDANQNGMLDGVEHGLPGVIVTLETAAGTSNSVLTNSNGGYQFAVVPGSNVRVTSSGPGGAFYPTTPESLVLHPPAAQIYPDNNFGYSDDADLAVVHGIVFNDLNSNGEQELGEEGLAGAVIALTDGVSTITATTGGNGLITGTFAFTVTQPGFYTVLEQNPPGYRSTTPDRVVVNASLGGSTYVEFGDTDRSDTASIYGSVFDDLNENGIQDSNETALEGVLISVTISGGTQVLTTTSGAQGQYAYGFEINEAGNHRVTEQDPAKPGYRSTTPDSVVLSIALGNSYIVDFGDTQNADFSTITGIVFDDNDGNGVQGIAELGIPGVLISLSNGITTTTGQFGAYILTTSETGFHQVSETDLPSYHSTTPNQVTVNIESTGNVYHVDFGDSDNLNTTSLYGTVFNDTNANGLRDMPSELGISGVTVHSSGSSGPYLTNQWGQYTFIIDVPGSYTLTESDLPGYFSTNAIPGSPVVSKVDENTLVASVTSFGTDLGDNLFGDVQANDVITISGFVWDDNGAGGGVAGDGIWDVGEPPLAGAVINLSSGLTDITASDGAFQLIAPVGEITVTENNPAGYISSNAIPGTGATKVDNDTLVISGLVGGSTSSGNLFGDIQSAELSITKQAAPNPVAAGATLTYTLGFANTGAWPAQEVSITDTLPTGVEFEGIVSTSEPFTFSGQDQETLVWQADTLGAGDEGTIVFTVTVKPDVVGSILNSVMINSSTQENDLENNLASVETTVGVPGTATLYGFVFEDLDGDGVWDETESAIPGVQVTLDGSITTTTNQDGRYHFLTDQLGVHSVIEEDPTGFFSTTPNEVHVAVLSGGSYRMDFGDAPETSEFAIVYGTVFKDLDSDGFWDADETGIPGVSVSLDQAYTTTTGLYGGFSLSSTISGTRQIIETDPESFISTTPNQVSLSIDIGQGYQVDFGDLQLCTCGPDSFEEDDTWQQAKPIQVGASYSQTHDFCDDAIDWLSFNAQAGQVYTITTTAWGQRADTNLTLYDSDSETILAANDDYEDQTDFSSRIVWQAPADGVYYILVDNRAALNCCDTEYDIWIETPEVTSYPIYLPLAIFNWVSTQEDEPDTNSPAGVISHVCPDAYEEDDSWQLAKTIQAGVLQTHSFDSNPAVFAADKDLVSFNIAGDETVVFSIETLTNTQTLLELYDAQGLALDVTGSTALSWTATNPGQYFLSISPIHQSDFGCSDVAGYDLLMEIQRQQYGIMLPLLMK